MIRLVNSAVMPAPGVYRLSRISAREFAQLLQDADRYGAWWSYIGYAQTAGLIERLTGVPVGISRDPAVVEDGDILLICRLRYRVQDPATKGAAVSDSDFEFFRCDYRAGEGGA